MNSVETNIALSLRSFKIANEIWQHLKKVYSQTNRVRQFDIEFNIARINQENRNIQSFYVELLKLWIELDMISASLVTSSAYENLKKKEIIVR